MNKKNKKDKRSRKHLPKPDRQIPISLVRPIRIGDTYPDLQNAREYPLYGCWIMTGWKDTGITSVVVARKQDNDHIMFGVYLMDYYCLGVKSASTWANYTRNRFERELDKMLSGAPESCSVELAHELIYGAIEYAEKLGFQPHPDFYHDKADLMLDPPDTHPRENNVSFGKDGKPLYISGPFDNELKSRSIINTLMRTCGEGNFDYIVMVGGKPGELV